MLRPIAPRTIAEGLARQDDNFLLLRFIAAALVIYGHAPTIVGGGPADAFVWLNWGEYSGAIAVDLFFITSGFLVTGSWLRRPHLADFAWARAIRILPAFAVCLVLSAAVLGPLFTTLPLRGYFSHPGTWGYVLENLQLGRRLAWELPGVFAGNPGTRIVNGSIWTLPAEVRLYAGLALLGAFGVLSRRWLFNAVALGAFAFSLWFFDAVPPALRDYVRLAGLFVAGAGCCIHRERIPLHGALLPALAALAWLCRATPAYPLLFAAGEIAFVFWFAYATPWRGFNRFGDYSYGIYLWGYPAQQAVAAVAGDLSVFANALCGFALALLLGIASWHGVEKPALRLKGLPGRWMRRRDRGATATQTDAA